MGYINIIFIRIHSKYPPTVDIVLEIDEDDLILNFTEFFKDVVQEFQAAGPLRRIVVSRNYEKHLAGNVYVQYARLVCFTYRIPLVYQFLYITLLPANHYFAQN